MMGPAGGCSRAWARVRLAVMATLAGLLCVGIFHAWLAPGNVAAWLNLAAFCS